MKFTFAPESKPLEGFTIKRAIDRGGFGEVYYALSDSGKEVALKLLQQNMDIELRGVTQCLNLSHPNLVTIFDVKTDRDGDHWVVMEYVSGQGLDKALHQNPNGMPMEQVRYWLSGISEGLSYLHSRGLVHRDLKPSNVFRDGEIVKIGDVGLSKFITHSRRSANTQSVGTVYYMAPEVARGRYGKEVDVYAMGVMVYEMITGVVPFEGESTAEILMKHLSEKPDLNRLPAHLRAVVGRALEKDPQKRIADIKDFKQQFEHALFQRETHTEIPENSFETPVDRIQTSSSNQSHNLNREYEDTHSKGMGSVFGKMSIPLVLCGLLFFLLFVGGGIPVVLLVIVAVLSCGGVALFGKGGQLLFGKSFAALVKGPPPISDLWDQGEKTQEHQDAKEYHQQKLEETRAFRDQSRKEAEEQRRRVREQHRRKPYYSRSLTPKTPRSISYPSRFYDLSVSMVKAVICTLVIVAGILCFTDGAIAEGFWNGTDFAPFALLTSGAIVAAWSVLLVAKMTEGKSFDNSTRRIIWLASGVIVGAIIFLIQSDVLLTTVANSQEASLRLRPFFNVIGPYALTLNNGQPSLIGYSIFFGMLFCFRRWWWHADSFRPRKFKVSSVLISVFTAYVITAVWAFPVSAALCWAAIISSVVQLSATWIPEEQRIVELKGENHV
ncbi:MAG: serine/threonine protein kinase [Planctomycetes bacterium]|nr:serine/threonine protein kinase [Planctomycetota bacterium]MCH9777585.1 serine/threonine protein kinase [Planctomycetota bacterium]